MVLMSAREIAADPAGWYAFEADAREAKDALAQKTGVECAVVEEWETESGLYWYGVTTRANALALIASDPERYGEI